MLCPKLTIGDSFLPLIDGTHQGRFVMCESRRGTGKTRAILTILVARARRYPNSTWLLARSTRTRLSGTVLKTLYKQVLPLFGIPTPSASASQVETIPVGNGSVLVPMGMDDLQRTQSAEFSGGYVAEGVEIEQADDVTSLTGAMREASGVPYHQVIVDCNPGPPGHWLNTICEPCDDSYRIIRSKADYLRTVRRNREPAAGGKWKRIVTHTADNPGYFNARTWEWTKLGKDYIDGLGYLQGHMRMRWLDGLWVAAEGGVYPQFNDTHIIEPFIVPTSWPWWVCFDAGYDHPCAVLWLTRGPAGCVYVAQEMYGSGYEIRDVCKHIAEQRKGRRVERIYGDPQMCFSKTQYSEKTIAQQFREFGVSLAPWPRTGSNSVAMVEAVRSLLTQQPDPGIKVFRTCENTINEFRSWRYKRTAAGALPSGDDQFEDKNNDCMDALRGGIAAGIARVGVSVRAMDEHGDEVPGVRVLEE
jgi:phage terminase large subunit